MHEKQSKKSFWESPRVGSTHFISVVLYRAVVGASLSNVPGGPLLARAAADIGMSGRVFQQTRY